jgi:hypothetical protein
VTLRVALALLLAAVSSQEAQQVGSMRSAVRVERVLVDAYVTTGSGGALSRVVRSLGGRYVLVFVKPEGPRGIHPLSVQLAGRKGDVVVRAYYRD